MSDVAIKQGVKIFRVLRPECEIVYSIFESNENEHST